MVNDHDERSPLLQNGHTEEGAGNDDDETVCKAKESDQPLMHFATK